MPSVKEAWLSLRGGRENGSRHQEDRVMAANYDTKQLLDYVKSQKNARAFGTLVDYLEEIEALTGELIKNLLGADWRKAMEDLRQDMLGARKDMHALCASIELPMSRVRSYAEVIQNAPSSSHAQSNHSTSSAGVGHANDYD